MKISKEDKREVFLDVLSIIASESKLSDYSLFQKMNEKYANSPIELQRFAFYMSGKLSGEGSMYSKFAEKDILGKKAPVLAKIHSLAKIRGFKNYNEAREFLSKRLEKVTESGISFLKA